MKILFFMRTGERTGSEIVLHNVICNADRQQIQMAVASTGHGPLLRQMPPDVPVFIYGQPPLAPSFYQRVVRRIKRICVQPPVSPDPVLSVIEEYGPDVCYVNTIFQPAVIDSLRQTGIPCVLHSHELEELLDYLREQDVRNIVEVPRLVIAASEAVARVLHELGRTENVEICYESVDYNNVKSDAGKSATLRKELGIADDAFVWAMSGTLNRNKNAALFVDLAHEMRQRGSNAHFLWLGSSVNGYSYYAKKKSEFLGGLAGGLTWAGALTDRYYDYLNVADGFVLTSVRDSFPLVMIEAAALGKPIVAFNSGGVKEFVQPGMGTVVDSWNAADLISAMTKVMKGETVIEPLVLQSQAKKFDVSAIVMAWEAIIGRHFKPEPTIATALDSDGAVGAVPPPELEANNGKHRQISKV